MIYAQDEEIVETGGRAEVPEVVQSLKLRFPSQVAQLSCEILGHHFHLVGSQLQ